MYGRIHPATLCSRFISAWHSGRCLGNKAIMHESPLFIACKRDNSLCHFQILYLNLKCLIDNSGLPYQIVDKDTVDIKKLNFSCDRTYLLTAVAYWIKVTFELKLRHKAAWRKVNLVSKSRRKKHTDLTDSCPITSVLFYRTSISSI